MAKKSLKISPKICVFPLTLVGVECIIGVNRREKVKKGGFPHFPHTFPHKNERSGEDAHRQV